MFIFAILQKAPPQPLPSRRFHLLQAWCPQALWSLFIMLPGQCDFHRAQNPRVHLCTRRLCGRESRKGPGTGLLNGIYSNDKGKGTITLDALAAARARQAACLKECSRSLAGMQGKGLGAQCTHSPSELRTSSKFLLSSHQSVFLDKC